MAEKPTILFVPGAWHKASCYTPIIQSLHTLGFPTATAELASVGPVPGLTTWDQDILNIRTVVQSLTTAGKNVILIAHSYGSLPAGEAIKGLLASDENKPGTGGVIHFIYISAFVLPPSTSLMDALGGKDLPWFSVSPSKLEVTPLDPATIFYNDLPSQEQQRHVAALETFSYQMFFQKTTWAPYREVPCSYVFCTEDKAIPLGVQRGMVEGVGGRWREWTVEAGHSPFLSRVEEVVRVVVGVVEGE